MSYVSRIWQNSKRFAVNTEAVLKRKLFVCWCDIPTILKRIKHHKEKEKNGFFIEHLCSPTNKKQFVLKGSFVSDFSVCTLQYHCLFDACVFYIFFCSVLLFILLFVHTYCCITLLSLFVENIYVEKYFSFSPSFVGYTVYPQRIIHIWFLEESIHSPFYASQDENKCDMNSKLFILVFFCFSFIFW